MIGILSRRAKSGKDTLEFAVTGVPQPERVVRPSQRRQQWARPPRGAADRAPQLGRRRVLSSARMSAPEAAALLKASAVFAGLPDRDITAVAAVAQEARCRPREYVFMEGDPAHWLYVVKTGRVKIFRQ